MKTLKFWGASDDLFEMGGDIDGEIGCYNNGASYLLSAESGRMIVYGIYAPDSTPGASWVVGVALVEEGVDLPAWPTRFVTAPPAGYPDPKSYSPLLLVDVPDDIQVTEL